MNNLLSNRHLGLLLLVLGVGIGGGLEPTLFGLPKHL